MPRNKCENWSSSVFTFQATSLDPVRSDYLFGTKDLTTKSVAQVQEVVNKVCDSQNTATFIGDATNAFPDEQEAMTKTNLNDFSGV